MKIVSAIQEEKSRIRQRREEQKEKIRNDLARYGSEILNSDEMQEAFRQTHHIRSTVGDHTRRVAEKSLAMCHALEKLHIRTDIPAVVTGSLCHDLGILGRDEKYGSGRECYRQHPDDSVEVARNLVDDLSGKTEDIIRNHMWPTPGSKAPNSLEGAIVSVADKAASVEDFIRGSTAKPADLKATAREFAKISRDYFQKAKK
ncbi:MAG: HD domain-containing protein [Oscillospiraceae bacterium]|nr:HD domain-containing protein [Oscillospiraceae bacterium]